MSALLWLLFRCATRGDDADTLPATLSHLHMLAHDPGVDGIVREACERLARQWTGELQTRHHTPAAAGLAQPPAVDRPELH